MNTKIDYGIITKIPCGENFEYVLEDNNYFNSTQYKILQGQMNNIFIPCMKIIRNGKISLYYIAQEYKTLSSMTETMDSDLMADVLIRLFDNLLEVQNNGFLDCQCINMSSDEIFIEKQTMNIKFVYLPISPKIVHSVAEFEQNLRVEIVNKLKQSIGQFSSRLEQLIADITNDSLTLEDIVHKYKGETTQQLERQQDKVTNIQEDTHELKLVAKNTPTYFECILNKDNILIGRKVGVVDIVIPFSNKISRQHCRIIRKDGAFYVIDEGSTSGTYVNKKRLENGKRYLIQQGDTISFADIEFEIFG